MARLAEFMFLVLLLRLHGTSELDGADRSKPSEDLAGVFLIHVEKVRHHGLYYWFVFVMRRHRNRTAKHLQRATVPVFDNVMQGGKSGINEGA